MPQHKPSDNVERLPSNLKSIGDRKPALIEEAEAVNILGHQPAGRIGVFMRVGLACLLVAAFADMPERQLVVAGDGPNMRTLTAAAPANVRLVGRVTDAERDRLLATARAFVFAAEEDFGIAPLEAQACGTPVIAFCRGGAAETLRGLDAPAPTGVFFAEQTSAAIRDAVIRFEQSAHRITASACRANAQRFDIAAFRERFGDYVSAAFDEFCAARERGSPPC